LNIEYRKGFLNEIISIWDFIALDSPNRATDFVNKIEQKIQDIPLLPYMHRKSIYFDDENIREMIHQGYVVVYKIDNTNKSIIILGIMKYKQTIEESDF